MYEPNPKNFSDLDEEDRQEERLNSINPHESENKVNKNNCFSSIGKSFLYPCPQNS